MHTYTKLNLCTLFFLSMFFGLLAAYCYDPVPASISAHIWNLKAKVLLDQPDLSQSAFAVMAKALNK